MAKGKRTNRPPSTGKPGTGGGQSRTAQVAPAAPAKQSANGSGSEMPSLPKRVSSTASTSATARPAARPAARQQPPRRRYERKEWWQTRWATIGAFVSIALVVVLFIVLAKNSTGGLSTDGQAVSPEVLTQITSVSPEVSAAVGTGGLHNPLIQVKPRVEVLKDASGKAMVVYVGGDFCPYCAAERWSVIVALSRFGTFSNLHYMSSSGSDSFPNTPTFTFYKSTYTSQYVNFAGVESQDRSGNPLQQLTSEQQQLVNKFDAPPYTQGGIPFMTFGNQYLTSGAGYSPDVLKNKSQAEIAKALSDPNAATTKGIVGNANYLTAAVCQLINDSAPACKVAPIPSIEQQLPKN